MIGFIEYIDGIFEFSDSCFDSASISGQTHFIGEFYIELSVDLVNSSSMLDLILKFGDAVSFIF